MYFDETAIVGHCQVAHLQNRVVPKFAHTQIAILASSYSDDVIAFEVKK